MAEREYLSNTREADVERSTEDIRQDIAKGEENISQTVEQIGEHIKEKLDWRGYVKDAPYWALGAAAGLGYLASGMFLRRTTPMERIMGSIAEEVRDSLGGLRTGAAGPGLIKVTLLGIATKAAASWIKNATSTSVASGSAVPRPQTGRGSTISPRVAT
ncbi:MAG: hypothetical protein NTY86_05705 [Deltaproteobacteria bacterium]|jgi:ElaB/YqjD/DUF883 family membrane-anchored ribosome-binding protein|nr:hypothetical protein [Deltaproteobacteria bacterium]